jgi:hypothetical protein
MSSTSRQSSNTESEKLAFEIARKLSPIGQRFGGDVPSSWDLVAATSALSNARCTVVSFAFAHGKTKAQQENFTLERQQRV